MSEYYYAVNDSREIISATNIDEAMVEWLEQDVYDEPLDSLPEDIEVFQWTPMAINARIKEQLYETINEYLTENCCHHEIDPPEIPESAELKFNEFFAELQKVYKPTILERTGQRTRVNLKKWLESYGWDIE